MEEGYIAIWNDCRGFGFINRGNGQPYVFIHISDIDEKWRPHEGDWVAFDVYYDDRKRLRAKNVMFVPYSSHREGGC